MQPPEPVQPSAKPAAAAAPEPHVNYQQTLYQADPAAPAPVPADTASAGSKVESSPGATAATGAELPAPAASLMGRLKAGVASAQSSLGGLAQSVVGRGADGEMWVWLAAAAITAVVALAVGLIAFALAKRQLLG